MTARHQSGVKTLQRAAGRIARIGEERFFGSFPLGIQSLELFPGEQNLAPNLELTGERLFLAFCSRPCFGP